MPQLQRIVQGRSATLTHTFYSDGVAADPVPDTATYTITRADGTVLATGGATEAGTGKVSVTVTPAQTALLDTWTVTWTATFGGQVQAFADTVEVAGDTIFTIADVRATTWGGATNNDTTYRISTASITAARTEVERVLEHELSFAMVPRYATETFDGNGSSVFMLSNPYPRVLRSVTVAGTALTVPQVATVSLSPTGRVYYPSAWTSGYGNVVVGYEHGLSVPPSGAKQVALALAKRLLTGAPADDRATSMSTDEQTTTFYVPGASEPFDVPAANRFVMAHSMRTGVA